MNQREREEKLQINGSNYDDSGNYKLMVIAGILATTN
jgi:hypothetical protein